MKLDRRSAVLGFTAVAATVAIVWLIVRPANPLPQAYRNDTYGFSLRLPADYTITELPNTNAQQENGTADVVELGDRSGAVRLTIIYASYASPELTTQSLLRNFPYLSGVQTLPFPIAANETGLAIDDDPSQPNQVSDVWFAQNGYLYQLTAQDSNGFNELLPIAHSLALF